MATGPGPTAPFLSWLDQVGVKGFTDLADQLWGDVPALQESPPGTREALRSSVVSHLPGLRATFAGPAHVPSLPGPARDFVEHMALADASLAGILRSYEVGHASIWSGYTRFLRESSISDVGRAEELEASSIRMFEYMQVMTSETVVAFNAVRMSVMQEHELRRREIVEGVLAGSLGAIDLHDRLGHRADEVHVGYVAWSDEDGPAGQVGASVRRHIAALARQHLVVPVGVSSVHGWFTPSSGSAYERLRDLELPPGVRAAFGAQRVGIDGFRHTHEEALLTSRVPTGRLVRFTDVAVEVLSTQRPDVARRFVDDQLGPLLRHESGDRFLDTLQHFLDTSGSPSRSGRRLGVHANTVAQRIRRIEEVLGHPVDPEDLALRVALAVRRALPVDPS